VLATTNRPEHVDAALRRPGRFDQVVWMGLPDEHGRAGYIHYAKENGVSDELLEKFAPLAKGDTILLIAIDGQPPKPAATGAERSSKPPRDPSSSRQGSYGGSGSGQGVARAHQ